MLAKANGMTYRELQVAETKGLVRIIEGKLVKKGAKKPK